jgi:hypothetical protein
MYSLSDDEDIDHDGTMSEDDPLGLHPNDGVEKETLDISSGEDKGSAKSKKKQKKDNEPKEFIENSPA